MRSRSMGGVCVLGGLAAACGAQCVQTLTFTEVSQQAGLVAAHDAPVWLQKLWTMSGGGVAAGDFDRDGFQDLFWLGTTGEADKLFMNNGDGTFTDAAGAWGVDASHLGVGASVADYNGDGWLDIYVTSMGPDWIDGNQGPGHHRLYRNNGDGTFTDVAAQAGVATTSASGPAGWSSSWGDYDLDGDLDLAVAGWETALDGNRLFRNEGDGTFTDVTASALPIDMSGVWGFAPRFCDMDGDRYPELLWVADFETGKYFVNNGDGTFADATAGSGAARDTNGMGTTIVDLDNDGDLDWYVTSIMKPPGTPITPGFVNGNALYVNQGGHAFVESASVLGVQEGHWGWATAAVDFDHDLDADIVATNGWHYSPFVDQPTKLWLQGGGGSAFLSEEVACNLVHETNGRGIVTFDYDNDGDQDVALASNKGPLRVFRNDLSGPCDGWVRVFLDTSCSDAPIPPDGVGSVVRVTVGGVMMTRVIQAGPNFLSQSELSAHFGVGDASVIDEVRVEWTDGSVTTLTDVAPDQTLTLVPCGGGCPGDVTTTGSSQGSGGFGEPDGTTDLSDLLYFVNTWSDAIGPSNGSEADVTTTGSSQGSGGFGDPDGTVDLADLLYFVNEWSGGLGCAR